MAEEDAGNRTRSKKMISSGDPKWKQPKGQGEEADGGGVGTLLAVVCGEALIASLTYMNKAKRALCSAVN